MSKVKPQHKSLEIPIEDCINQNCNSSTGECNKSGKCLYKSILTKGKIYCLKFPPLKNYVKGE